ncbi:hypothetical protein [Saccharicrinis aurantiacus]|uniref:hypothetical protein n=1 Tax=Saccharicrinis aurantiacus TaxID=1849719 RepID=UPI0015C57851|nr:hypothetical protein [Saccharicrinis aurantiacus]
MKDSLKKFKKYQVKKQKAKGGTGSLWTSCMTNCVPGVMHSQGVDNSTAIRICASTYC